MKRPLDNKKRALNIKAKIFIEKIIEREIKNGMSRKFISFRKDYGEFHKGAALVKYHGLHFNLDEECEKTDAEQMKYQVSTYFLELKTEAVVATLIFGE